MQVLRGLFVPYRVKFMEYRWVLSQAELEDSYLWFKRLVDSLQPALNRIDDEKARVDLLACLFKLAYPGEKYAKAYLKRHLKRFLPGVLGDPAIEEALRGNLWLIPADTRPGMNTSSLIAHQLATAAISNALSGGELNFRVACLLHDIGKGYLDEGVEKPYVKHAERGAKVLQSKLSTFASAASLVEEHHRAENIVSRCDRIASAIDRLLELIELAIGSELKELAREAGIIREEGLTRALYMDKSLQYFWDKVPLEKQAKLSEKFVREAHMYRDKLTLTGEPVSGVLLLYADARRIKRFVDGSSYIREMRGGSKLVSKAVERLAHVVSQRLGPENVIVAGGGVLFAIANREVAEDVRREAANCESELGLSFTVTEETLLDQVPLGIQWQKLVSRCGVEKLDLTKLRKPVIPGSAELCSSCGERPATGYIREEPVCALCERKYNEGESTIMEILRALGEVVKPGAFEGILDNIPDFLAGVPQELLKKELREHPMDLAVVKADGNLMGWFIGSSVSLTELIEKSSRIYGAMDAVKHEVMEMARSLGGSYELRFRCGRIYCEGDDFLWLMPAWASLRAALKVAETFYDMMGGVCSLSVAVVAFNPRYPLYMAMSLAEAMLKHTKEVYRRRMSEKLPDGRLADIGYMDFEDLSTTKVTARSFKAVRARQGKTTARPYRIPADGRGGILELLEIMLGKESEGRSVKPSDRAAFIKELAGESCKSRLQRIKDARRIVGRMLSYFKLEDIETEAKLALMYAARQHARGVERAQLYLDCFNLLYPMLSESGASMLMDAYIALRICGAAVDEEVLCIGREN